MITTRARLSLTEKIMIAESGAQLSSGQILNRFFGGGKLIIEYFESKF